MTPQEAFENVTKCSRSVQGTADFHDVVKESLRIVESRMALAAVLETKIQSGELVPRMPQPGETPLPPPIHALPPNGGYPGVPPPKA